MGTCLRRSRPNSTLKLTVNLAALGCPQLNVSRYADDATTDVRRGGYGLTESRASRSSSSLSKRSMHFIVSYGLFTEPE
jgi:hypothetical protein